MTMTSKKNSYGVFFYGHGYLLVNKVILIFVDNCKARRVPRQDCRLLKSENDQRDVY